VQGHSKVLGNIRADEVKMFMFINELYKNEWEECEDK
jgi:hypothetical protein